MVGPAGRRSGAVDRKGVAAGSEGQVEAAAPSNAGPSTSSPSTSASRNPSLWVFSVGPDGPLTRVDSGIPTGPNHGGGLARDRDAGKLYFASTSESGPTEQYELHAEAGCVLGRKVRTIPTRTQCEGAADDAAGLLYIAEENTGVWVLPTDPAPSELVLKLGDHGVEGVAVVPTGDASGYVLVSDQGRAKVVLLDRATHAYLGTFAIEGAGDTDGLDAARGDFGPRFPGGLFACHTYRTDLTPHPGKPILVAPWERVERAVVEKREASAR